MFMSLKDVFRGSNIQVIKDKTGAFVYVDKENVPTQYAGRCIIRGNSVQVQAAEKRVLELLARRDLNILEQCIAAHTNASFAKQMSAQPKVALLQNIETSIFNQLFKTVSPLCYLGSFKSIKFHSILR